MNKLTIEDYEDALADVRKLTRDLDVAMHGEEGAAKQASLCDLIEPARQMRATIARLTAERDRIREALETILEHCGNYGRGNVMVDARIVDRVDEAARAALKETEHD